MESRILLSLFLACYGGKLFAHPSLFFTEKEIASLRKESVPSASGSSGGIYLSAILYFDENNWSLWVNDKVLGPETSHDLGTFHLEGVDHDKAIFSWVPSEGAKPQTFSLHPNQTYIASTQMIVDGMEK